MGADTHESTQTLEWSRSSRVDLRSFTRQQTSQDSSANSPISLVPNIPAAKPLALALVRVSSIEKSRVLLGQASRPGRFFRSHVLSEGAVILIPTSRRSSKATSVDERCRIKLTPLGRQTLGSAPLLVAQAPDNQFIFLISTRAVSVSIPETVLGEVMDNHG